MKTLNCEYVREAYADVLHGALDAATATAVRTHLAGCAECRAEADVIDALYAAPQLVPPGLHERVARAVAVAPRPRRFAPRHLAMAATVAAALIGGTVLLQSTGGPDAVPAAENGGGLGFVTVEAAMMSGTGSLQDLTIEELEQLLGEIDS
jgi:anti-sigma factor RsiW